MKTKYQFYVIFLFTGIIFTTSCKKETTETPKYEFVKEWGQLGIGQGQFNDPTKIEVTKDFLFINDRLNNEIMKFDKDGLFISQLDFSSPFYIYNDTLYVLNPNDNNIIKKYDLDFNFISEMVCNTDFEGVEEFTGNADYALATTYFDTCFLIGINYKTNEIIRTGTLGTDALEFNWNGNLIPSLYNNQFIITDPDNNRIQIVNKNLEYVTEFVTDPESEYHPNVMAINSKYIAASNSNSGQGELHFYDITNYKKQFTIEIDGFIGCVGFYNNELYLYQSDIGVLKVYNLK